MPHRPTKVEAEGGEVKYIYFEIPRRELRNVVDEIAMMIGERGDIQGVKPIRRTDKNPVIKTGRNDKVYFKWDEGEVRVSIELAKKPVDDITLAYFIAEVSEQEAEEMPFDMGEMAEAARQYIRKNREQSEQEPTAEPSQPSDERKRKAREEGDHRDEEQREPRGGDERRVREKAEIVDGKTVFVPPYEKDEVEYHGPGEGENSHLDCKDCVHYIKGGGCHMVQGEVDRDGYCEDLFADMGLFARLYEGQFQINLALWGEMFEDRFGRVSFQAIADRVKEAIQRKL